jgi:hypothetical protein
MENPLLEYIEAQLQPYTEISDGWKTMLKDHRPQLLETAETIIITAYNQKIYQHTIEDFLRYKGYPISASWIVLWLNDLPSNMEFKNVPRLLLPDTKYLNTLYQTYLSIQKQKQSKVK